MSRYRGYRNKNRRLLYFFTIVILISILLAFIYRFAFSNGNPIAQLPFFIGNKNSTPKELQVQFDDYLTPRTHTKQNPYSQRETIKGIFVTGPTARSASKLDNLIQLANDTEINAFVIDVKDDNGKITFDMDVPLVDEIGAEINQINIENVMNKLYDNDIYPIARIVVFKDPYLSEQKPEYAIKNKDGSLWKYKDVPWLNPYNKNNWNYILDIAKSAASAGFKEIQFDYIRFEATKQLNDADFGPDAGNKTRTEVISEFVEYAVNELEPYDVEVSADVFGIIISSELDSKTIGQDYLAMAEKLDVICPMVYPSHYGFGYFGIPKEKHSDLYPYETIRGSMEASNEKYSQFENSIQGAVVRPWLQAFTAGYLGDGNYKVYGGAEIRQQIQAVYDAGLEEWLLWNSKSSYTSDGLMPKE